MSNQRQEISFPQVLEQQVMWGYQRDFHQADKYKALVNPETEKVFSVVSKDYRLIRHEEAVKRIEEAISRTPELGSHRIEAGFYNDGGRMRLRYIFQDVSVEIEEGDSVNPELQLFNSYDLTWPFIVILGAFRIICTNGLVVGEKLVHLKKRHTRQLDQIDLREELTTALERFYLQTDQWKEWASYQLSSKTYNRVMEDMKFGAKATEEIEKRAEQRAEGFDDYGFPIINGWIFFNILTWYITHRAVSLNHRVVKEKRLRTAKDHFKGK
jgi:hypothetical protein